MKFGVLWDFDGVIADTGELHYQAWARILAEMGVPFNREIFGRAFGMTNAGSLPLWIGRPLSPESISEISDRKEELFRAEARGRVALLPGVRSWLDRLQAQGIRQAVASSAPPTNIEVLIDALRIRGYFAAIVSADNMPGKPDPAVFLEAARRIELPPELCVVVEDSLPGIEAALRAGMKCISVANTHPPDALRAADLVVATLEALPPGAFQRLFSESKPLLEPSP
jgi:HAD superfamily hydrolase (TIGR01509 family)